MKNVKQVPMRTKLNKVPDVKFKDTFVNLKSYGMRQIRQAIQDLERGRFTF